MKKISKLSLIVLLICLSLSTYVFAAEPEPRSVDDVLLDIEQAQGVTNVQAIDPSKVSVLMLEELGDSVMESLIGNPTIHDQIDERLGGEGSASLTNFHKELGYAYLTGNQSRIMGLMMDAMMSGMMGYWGAGSNPVFFGWIWIVNAVLFVTLVILLLILLKRSVRRRRNN